MSQRSQVDIAAVEGNVLDSAPVEKVLLGTVVAERAKG